MHSHVAFESASLIESSAAHLADVRLVAGVNENVAFQSPGKRETFPTDVARVRPFACVHTKVVFQKFMVLEGLIAMAALNRPVTGMNSLVVV